MAGQLTEIDENPATQSLADRDAASVIGTVKVGEMARVAALSSGIPIKKIGKRMRALTGGMGLEKGGVGHLNGVDFLRWRLYELPRKEQERFLSDARQWEIESICNDQALAHSTVHKSECTAILEEAGLPTIAIEAVVDRSGSRDHPFRTVSTPSELLDFLGDVPPPLFAKPESLLGSFGAFRIEEVADAQVRITGDGWVDADDLLERLIGGETYLLQKILENHDVLAGLSPRLGTVRTVNLVGPDHVATPFCIYKIPAAGNIADNFWRQGNLLADVDPDTGTVRRVVTGFGGEQRELSHHPDSGLEILNMTLPFWNELRAVNEACCRTFAGIRYQCLDLAITNSGPVIVEVNSGGSFDLPQVATGRGLLTDEVRDFFESLGVDLHTRP